jgi:hypothetical protein
MKKKIRVTFYIEEDMYLLLRSQLIIKKMTVSSWLRERVSRFVDNHLKGDK